MKDIRRISIFPYLSLILISILSCLFSCNLQIKDSHNWEDASQVKLNDFKKVSLKFKESKLFVGVASDILVADTFLVISKLRDSVVLNIYGLHSLELLAKIIPRGVNKGECLSISNLIKTDDPKNIWGFDITSQKFIQIELPKAVATRNYMPEKEFEIGKNIRGVKSPQWINDSLFASLSYATQNCRIIHFTNHGKIVQRIGSLPPKLGIWPDSNRHGIFSLLAMAYSANMTRNLKSGRIAVGYTTTDRIEIYDQKKLAKVIQGPGFFKPDLMFRKTNDIRTPIPDIDTKYAFMKMVSSTSKIYALYSGENNFNTCGQRILVFDWNGQPLKQLMLNDTFCSFAITEGKNQSTIFTINSASGKLYYASF